MTQTAAVVVAATLVVVAAASAAIAASVAGTEGAGPTVAQEGKSEEYDAWVAPGTGGQVERGREDDDEQQYPGKTTFRLVNTHNPGVSNATFQIFAQGFTEDIRQFWNIVYQPDFTWSTCTSSDAGAFGVDRGNDQQGTQTDESFLQAYEQVTYHEDGIRVKFYKEGTLAGNPKVIRVEDEVVSQVNECLTTPDEPGWYRMTGYINGSTKNDTQTDYTIYGAARYVYICEGCDSREEARQVLGPEPTNCPTQWGQEFICRTEGGEYYTASEPPGGGDVNQSQSTPTPTEAGGDGATPTPTEASVGDTDGDDPTPTPKRGSDDDRDGRQDDQDDRQDDRDVRRNDDRRTAQRRGPVQTAAPVVTPTIGQGPGFGPVVAFAALLLAALLALRRER